ncbi:hypothetical protein [Nautilia sp.]
MKKLLISTVFAGALLLTGCGNSGSDSNPSAPVYQAGDDYIKTIATANRVLYVDFQREDFNFYQFNNLTEYVNAINQSLACEKGDINFSVVSTDGNNCGIYKTAAHNCYIGGKLFFDGTMEIKTININNEGCGRVYVKAETNLTEEKVILGKDVNITYLKDFNKTYSGTSAKYYNITANGEILAGDEDLKLEGYNVYVESDYYRFVYNLGKIVTKDYNLSFSAYGDKVETDANGDITQGGAFLFIANGTFYSLLNTEDGKVYVSDFNGTVISNDYNFSDVYSVYFK